MKIYPSAQHKQSVPYLIFICLIILQSLAVGTIMLKQHGMGEEILLTHAKEMMQRLADGAIFNASHHLQSAEDTAHITRGLIKDAIISPDAAEHFEMYLLEMLKNHDAFSGLTYGDHEGKLLYVSRNPKHQRSSYLCKRISFKNHVKQETIIQRDADFIPLGKVDIKDNYDPRTRPWYDSYRKQKLLWTVPYIFYTSNDPGITVSIPVVDENDNLTGAFGVDIEIHSLSEFLSRRKISPHSSAFIVGRGGAIAAHSDLDLIKKTDTHGYSQLLNISELTTDPVLKRLWALIKNLDEQSLLKGTTFAFQVNDAKYLAVVRSFPEDSEWPWIMTVLAPENDFIGIFRKAKRNKLLQALLYSIGITLFIFLLAANFLKPVRRLLYHAHFDPMTNLYNRRAFFEHCEKKEAEARLNNTPQCLAMLDVDNFKMINDTYGHGVGDELLIALAGRLRGALSDDDLIARYGGEEFIVLITNATLKQGIRVSERLRKVIADTPFRTEAGQIKTSVSIGVAPLSGCPDAQEAITLADNALLRAKAAGKNTVISTED